MIACFKTNSQVIKIAILNPTNYFQAAKSCIPFLGEYDCLISESAYFNIEEEDCLLYK